MLQMASSTVAIVRAERLDAVWGGFNDLREPPPSKRAAQFSDFDLHFLTADDPGNKQGSTIGQSSQPIAAIDQFLDSDDFGSGQLGGTG